MTIQNRKNEHIRICLEENVQGQGITSGFAAYRFSRYTPASRSGGARSRPRC
jgi:hypothetical protein